MHALTKGNQVNFLDMPFVFHIYIKIQYIFFIQFPPISYNLHYLYLAKNRPVSKKDVKKNRILL